MNAKLALVHDTSAPPLSLDKLSDTTGEPRIRDVDLAERLGFADVQKIRALIERNAGELRTYGSISATVAENKDPRGRGRPGKVSWLNEGQALVLCALSRTPRAAAVRKQVIDVFLAYRAGRLAPAAPAPAAAPAPEPDGLDALRAEARALAEAAAALLARVDAQERGVGPRRAARRPGAGNALPAPSPAADGPMLHGLRAIGGHLGITADAARHLSKTQGLPIYRLGKTVCSGVGLLDAWLADKAADARRGA